MENRTSRDKGVVGRQVKVKNARGTFRIYAVNSDGSYDVCRVQPGRGGRCVEHVLRREQFTFLRGAYQRPLQKGDVVVRGRQESGQGEQMDITQQEKTVLRAVKNGGDVYDRATAVALRALEKRGLVTIVRAVAPPTGDKAQPYFGAIATKAGIAAIRR